MKKIILLFMLVSLSALVFAGIPHPVFVDYELGGSPESFEAYLSSDISSMLHENSIGCGILSTYRLIMVECGNFPIWNYADTLYIVKTDGDLLHHIGIELNYDNVQVQTDAIWVEGPPPTEELITVANVFNPGWNLWSHNYVLADSNVVAVFDTLDHLTKVKSITQSYDPDLLPQFNTLTTIVDGYGYWVQVSELDTLEVGEASILTLSGTLINLDSGWNLIGYIPQTEDDVTHAYADMIDSETPENSNLLKVKSITQSFDPRLQGQFNTLETLSPGNGYWIKVETEVIGFTYPAPASITRGNTKAAYAWSPVIYTNSTCAYAEISESYGQIGAFVKGECRAVTEINDGYVSLVINGEEAETATFKLYQNGVVTNLNTQITTAPGADVFFDFTADAPELIEGMKVYPNPFNPEAKISYTISQPGMVSISVYNVKGQKVQELVNEDQEAGKHSISWNAVAQASGIYFVKMSTGGFDQVQKLILMK